MSWRSIFWPRPAMRSMPGRRSSASSSRTRHGPPRAPRRCGPRSCSGTPTGASVQTGPMLARIWDDLATTHPSAASRNADLRPYVEREYGEQVVRKRRAELERFLGRPEVKLLLAEAQTLDDARTLLLGNDPGKAVARLQGLGRSPIAGSSFAQLVLAKSLQASGRGEPALIAAKAAATGPYGTMPAGLLVAVLRRKRPRRTRTH